MWVAGERQPPGGNAFGNVLAVVHRPHDERRQGTIERSVDVRVDGRVDPVRDDFDGRRHTARATHTFDEARRNDDGARAIEPGGPLHRQLAALPHGVDEQVGLGQQGIEVGARPGEVERWRARTDRGVRLTALGRVEQRAELIR
jgi:hypothetical protein